MTGVIDFRCPDRKSLAHDVKKHISDIGKLPMPLDLDGFRNVFRYTKEVLHARIFNLSHFYKYTHVLVTESKNYLNVYVLLKVFR